MFIHVPSQLLQFTTDIHILFTWMTFFFSLNQKFMFYTNVKMYFFLWLFVKTCSTLPSKLHYFFVFLLFFCHVAIGFIVFSFRFEQISRCVNLLVIKIIDVSRILFSFSYIFFRVINHHWHSEK